MSNDKVKMLRVSVLHNGIDLHTLYKKSAYTIVGCNGDLFDWMDNYNRELKNAGVGTPSEYIMFKGKLVNDTYNLKGHNRFDDDLVFLSFTYDNLDASKLAKFKLDWKDKWFDELINSSVDRGKVGGINVSIPADIMVYLPLVKPKISNSKAFKYTIKLKDYVTLVSNKTNCIVSKHECDENYSNPSKSTIKSLLSKSVDQIYYSNDSDYLGNKSSNEYIHYILLCGDSNMDDLVFEIVNSKIDSHVNKAINKVLHNGVVSQEDLDLLLSVLLEFDEE